MESKKFVKILLWGLCLLFVIEFSCGLISAADTFLNVLGLVIMLIFGFMSYKTKCFTTIKNKK